MCFTHCLCSLCVFYTNPLPCTALINLLNAILRKSLGLHKSLIIYLVRSQLHLLNLLRSLAQSCTSSSTRVVDTGCLLTTADRCFLTDFYHFCANYELVRPQCLCLNKLFDIYRMLMIKLDWNWLFQHTPGAMFFDPGETWFINCAVLHNVVAQSCTGLYLFRYLVWFFKLIGRHVMNRPGLSSAFLCIA